MTPTPAQKPNRWRFTAQLISAMAFLATPFLTISGTPLLRLDLREGVLYLFTITLRSDNLIVLFLFIVTMVFALFWLSASFGRLWCGWGCPQSSISDLAAWLRRQVKARIKAKPVAGAALHLALALCTAPFALAFMCYFFAPAEVLSGRLYAGSPVALVVTGGLWLALYLNMAFVGRGFCRTVCPYGKVITIMGDADSMIVEMNPATAHECIQCGACNRVCPMGLDVRRGAGPDCVQCGRCIEACGAVMQKRGTTTLIRYGRSDDRPLSVARMMFAPSRWPLIAATALALGLLVAVAASPAGVKLSLRVSPTAGVRALDADSIVVFVKGSVTNRNDDDATYTMKYAGDGIEGMRGVPGTFTVAAGEVRHIDFALVIERGRGARPLTATFTVVAEDGAPVASNVLNLPGFTVAGQ